MSATVLVCVLAGCAPMPPLAGPGLPPEDATVHVRLNQPRALDLRKANGEVIRLTDAQILIGRLRPSYSADSIRLFVSEVRERSGGQHSLPLGTMAVLPRDSTMTMTVLTANSTAMKMSMVMAGGIIAGVLLGFALLLGGWNGT